jgi:hypothetical protein
MCFVDQYLNHLNSMTIYIFDKNIDIVDLYVKYSRFIKIFANRIW